METIVPIAEGKTTNTVDDVRAHLARNGKSLRKLCTENGLDWQATKSLFRITKPAKGNYGKSHISAVALGLKPPVDATPN